jgi:hypothetical protein
MVDDNCVAYDQSGIICTACNQGYHPDCQGRCQPNQWGCTYKNGLCASCSPPFAYNAQANTCEIPYCQETCASGCQKCRPPFSPTQDGTCGIANCLRWGSQGCLQCKPQFHFKNGGCVQDNPNCQIYNDTGVCELCADKYVIGSDG